MKQMYVVGEDALCCALAERLVDQVGWSLALPAINTGGVTRLISAIPRYTGLAKNYPVLCLADTDGQCVVELRKAWLPAHSPAKFILRLAVTESESWLLADREGLAKFLDISSVKLPLCPDDIDDAKRALLNAARRSRRRELRQELVSSTDPNKPGSGYNMHLCSFVTNHWDPLAAANQSPSLARAIVSLRALG